MMPKAAPLCRALRSRQRLGRVPIKSVRFARLAECPLRSESDGIAASPRNDARGQKATSLAADYVLHAAALAQLAVSLAFGGSYGAIVRLKSALRWSLVPPVGSESPLPHGSLMTDTISSWWRAGSVRFRNWPVVSNKHMVCRLTLSAQI